MSSRELIASRQYIVKELISYTDETFPLLFRDIGNFSANISEQVFGQSDRRISIYGVRGLGKTTAMQGAFWLGLKDNKQPIIPLNVVVSNIHNATRQEEVADQFYKAVVLSISRAAKATKFKKEMIKAAKQYAPWVAKRITEVASIMFPAMGSAASIAQKGIDQLARKTGQKDAESILTSSNANVQQHAAFLLDNLMDQGGKPVFIIDELDKVENDTVLSDFFDSNQAWFQGKQGMISLSYTFGESIKEASATSVKRISKLEPIPGVTSFEDAAELIRARARLGLASIAKSEKEADAMVVRLFSDETITAALNLAAPNAHLILERVSLAMNAAIKEKSPTVMPSHFERSPEEELVPTGLQSGILRLLLRGRDSPSVVAEKLDKDMGLISRTLKKMYLLNWVGRVGHGKKVYYHLTPKGEAALRRVPP